MKKRIAAFILVVSLGISVLAGCGNDSGQPRGGVPVDGSGAFDAAGNFSVASDAETNMGTGASSSEEESYDGKLVSDGMMEVDYAGCEIFAAYNAIYSIVGRHDVTLPEMIAAFESDGMVLSGQFGTAPKAVRDFLERQGFRTEFVTNESQFEDVGERSQSLILTMYNDKDDIRREVHTVSISKAPDGYRAHNVNCNGDVLGPCGSLRELMAQMNGGRIKAVSMIGVAL